MLQTVTYTGTKLLPLYPREGGNATIKLATGTYRYGQILEETAIAGTFRALRTAANARLVLERDTVVDTDGMHWPGQQANAEPSSGDIYTSAYPDGVFDTRDLLGILPSASLTTALTGTNNDLVFSAVPSGAAGNAITVAYVDPAGNSVTLLVTVTGNAISVRLATDGSGVITSTAAQVAAAIAALPAAAALVTAANAASNNGTGVVTAMAATALAGGSDTTAGITDDATGDAIVAALGRLESGKNSAGILHIF